MPDIKIIKTIQAIDCCIDSIVENETTYIPKKFTLISNNSVEIRHLTEKKEVINIILADTVFNFKDYWDRMNHDTIVFLSNYLIKSEFDLNYPDYLYPKVLTSVDPGAFQNQLRCKHILFYTRQLELTIDAISKTLNKNNRRTFYQYLARNIDYFNKNDKKFIPKAIRILTITFSDNNLIYAGVDIYGSHYQLTFDADNAWHLDSVKELWTY